ncbi:Cytosolic sulfotransferase 16 [Acorus gramineus]|uniref:Sulfotransferase n=1 Tax=Acorus gramineus TaxID=55184 RepID=A0AAV9A3S2_ACOGR|nr:Cytosolic sulfotransferase 16 [Acorus gramineus]
MDGRSKVSGRIHFISSDILPTNTYPFTPNKMKGEETRVDEKTQEKYAHLISTLPKKKSWGRYLHMYHGFWYSSFVLHGVMSVQDNFKAHPSDVLIASFPKSGTTWLKALVFALLNRSTGDQTSKQVMHSLNPHEYVPHLEVQLYMHNMLPDLDSFPHQDFLPLTFLLCASRIREGGLQLSHSLHWP